jgi:hypothetical protein
MFDWMRRKIEERRERKRLAAERQAAVSRKPDEDDGFDTGGMAIGYAAGIPVGSRGITTGALMGYALSPSHAIGSTEDQYARQAAVKPYEPMVDYGSYSSPTSEPSPSCSSSSSYDSSSSGGSFDSGSCSSSGGGDF